MIELRNLSKHYQELTVLKDINLTIHQGEKVAIVGPSGSGKSTLLRCLNRMEEPSGGSIFFKGVDIAGDKADINHYRRDIGMVFQQFNLFNNMTVLDNITLAPIQTGLQALRKERMKRIPDRLRAVLSPGRKVPPGSRQATASIKQEARAKALRLLEQIGLEDKEGVYPSTLSGGQKQRIAIIRALAMDPAVMLFDEPTSSLDPEMVGEVLDLIKSLAQGGMTMLIVTHEMAFAREIATRILFMDEGEILEDTSPENFFTQPSNPRARAFLSKLL